MMQLSLILPLVSPPGPSSRGLGRRNRQVAAAPLIWLRLSDAVAAAVDDVGASTAVADAAVDAVT